MLMFFFLFLFIYFFFAERVWACWQGEPTSQMFTGASRRLLLLGPIRSSLTRVS